MSKLDKVTSLEELATHFQTKLTGINQCVQLRDARSDPAVHSMMTGLGQSLTELSTILTLMKAELAQRRKALGSVQDMKHLATSLQGRIDHAKDNLPARMPKKQVGPTQSTNKENNEVQPKATEQPTPRKPLSETNSNTKNNEPKKTGPKKTKQAIPALEYLTVEEFDSVPKYMKGRLTYEKINAALEELNKAFAGKYTLLATKRSAQTDFIKKKIVSYKEEETKDTKGIHFIKDTDIKEYTTLKVDKVCQSIITLIRHCGRIREIRGGGMTRYAICR